MGIRRIAESGTNPRSGVLDSSGRHYTRNIILTVDSTADNVTSILGYLASLDIYWGQVYTITDEGGILVNYDADAFITSIAPKQRADTPYLWDVVIQYGPWQLPGGAGAIHPTNAPVRSGGDPQQNPNIEPDPMSRRPIYVWSSTPISKPMEVDRDGFGVVNAAFQPFTNRPTREIYASRLTITRNELTFDAGAMEAYRGTVNAVQFLHAQAGNAKMTDITARSIYEGQYAYYEVNYVIDILPDPPSSAGTADFKLFKQATGFAFNQITVHYSPWDPVLLNQGRKYVSGGVLKDIITPGSGRPTTIDVPLDETGAILAPGSKPVYLLYKRHTASNFDILALV